MRGSDLPPGAMLRSRPGGSAQSYYEEQRRAWIRRNRRFFALLDLAATAIIVASIVLWLVWPPSAWYGGLFAGIALCFDLVARLNPPTWIEQWQSGAFGEQRTARELSKLGDDWLVLHDLRRRDGSNIDHVVVGPPGVLLLDSKNIGTEVRVDGDVLVALRPDGRQRYSDRTAARKVRGAAAALSDALRVAGVGCWVHAFIIVWGDMAQSHAASTNLDWVAGAHVVDWLTSLPAARNQDRLTQIKDALVRGAVVV